MLSQFAIIKSCLDERSGGRCGRGERKAFSMAICAAMSAKTKCKAEEWRKSGLEKTRLPIFDIACRSREDQWTCGRSFKESARAARWWQIFSRNLFISTVKSLGITDSVLSVGGPNPRCLYFLHMVHHIIISTSSAIFSLPTTSFLFLIPRP